MVPWPQFFHLSLRRLWKEEKVTGSEAQGQRPKGEEPLDVLESSHHVSSSPRTKTVLKTTCLQVLRPASFLPRESFLTPCDTGSPCHSLNRSTTCSQRIISHRGFFFFFFFLLLLYLLSFDFFKNSLSRGAYEAVPPALGNLETQASVEGTGRLTPWTAQRRPLKTWPEPFQRTL